VKPTLEKNFNEKIGFIFGFIIFLLLLGAYMLLKKVGNKNE